MVLHQSWLNARPFLIGVQFDHMVHVLGKIEHQGFAHGLTGEAGAAARGRMAALCLRAIRSVSCTSAFVFGNTTPTGSISYMLASVLYIFS